MYNVYNRLAEQPGVAHGTKKLNLKKIFVEKTPHDHSWVSTKNFSPIGPAVWQAIGNYIYTNVSLYYVDMQTNWIIYLFNSILFFLFTLFSVFAKTWMSQKNNFKILLSIIFL